MAVEVYNLGIEVSVNIKCPRCRSKNVVVEVCEGGYIFVYKCEGCGYLRKKSVC